MITVTRARSWWAHLTPAGMASSAIGLVLLAVVAFLVLGRLGFHFDPFNLTGRKVDRLEHQVAGQADDLAGRQAELEGERQQAQRVEIYVRQAGQAQAAVAALTEAARTAPDAHAPLDPDRARRLLDNDLQLCRADPRLCPAAGGGRRAADTAAESGAGSVRALPPAAEPD